MNCEYDYQLVEGLLDSYPVVSSGECIIATTTENCGLSTSSPCIVITSNAGDQNLILLFIFGLMFYYFVRGLIKKKPIENTLSI
jgi:hypothetical protein